MKNSTLLIAEDNKELAALYGGFFKKLFKKVIVVHSGSEAIARLKVSTVDAVLTDINMPNGTGQDLIEFISKQEYKQPIVIVTAHSELRSIYDEEECIAVHSKPADMKLILDDLRRMLAKREDCDGDSIYERLGKLTEHVDAFLATLSNPGCNKLDKGA